MGIGQELRDVLNLETVNQILIEALRRGGDFADVFAEQRFRTTIVLDDSKIDSVTYGYPRGAGVRVLRRKQTGLRVLGRDRVQRSPRRGARRLERRPESEPGAPTGRDAPKRASAVPARRSRSR